MERFERMLCGRRTQGIFIIFFLNEVESFESNVEVCKHVISFFDDTSGLMGNLGVFEINSWPTSHCKYCITFSLNCYNLQLLLRLIFNISHILFF